MQDHATATNPSEPVLTPHKEGYENGPLKLQRDEFGLLKNVDYKFTADGFINWRAMIEPEFLFPNKEWFKKHDQQIPDSINGLEDYQLIIKIGGLNKLAAIRGFTAVEHFVKHVNDNWVYDECRIEWLPNYETDMKAVSYSYGANSNDDNCGDFMKSFKETQAEYRSQSLCIRKFLNINIVGDAEISKGMVEQEVVSSAMNPQKNLEKLALSKGFNSYESLKKVLLLPSKFAPKEKPKTNWTGYADIPANECWRISTLLENK